MNILRLFRKLKTHCKDIKFSQSERVEILLSGSGGQGIALAGRILAEAASIYDNQQAVMSQSYGPEARGGASRSEVVISSKPIQYPKVMNIDICLVMTKESLDKYECLLDSEGLLIVNETFITDVPSRFKKVFKAPFSELAIKLIKAPIVANIIALGALAAITKVVSREALIRAILDGVPQKALIADRIAVDTGFKAVMDTGFNWTGKSRSIKL